VCRLAKKCKELYPEKTVWMYTGFLWENVKDEEVMNYVDVLLEGKYMKELNDNNLHWVGSSNQRVINIPETLKTGKIVLHE
jgi:anaerobic ribonucleoside-triphosphate reductase activating protein